MVKKISRILSILCSLVLFFSLMACGGNKTGGTSDDVSEQGPSDTDGKLEDYVVSLYIEDPCGDMGIQTTEIANVIYEKTGVKMDLYWSTADDVATQLALHLAGGELFEIYQAVNYMGALVDSDNAVDLLPLIEEHGPNLKKRLGSYFEFWMKSDNPTGEPKWEGKLFHIRNKTAPPGAEKVNTELFGGFTIRYDLLKELGFPKVETTTDWYNVLKEMLKRWPQTDDGQQAIGFTTNLGDDWSWEWSFMNPFHSGSGIYTRATYYINDNDEIILVGSREDTEYFWKAVEFYNRMYREGIMDPAILETNYDIALQKAASGRVYSFVVPWFVEESEIEKIWHEQGQDKAYIVLNLRADGYTGKTLWSYWGPESTGRHVLRVTKAAKDPVRIVKFLDFLASDEGHLLTGRGIENKHYKWEGNKIVMTPEFYEESTKPDFQRKTGLGYYNFVMEKGIAPGTVDQPTFYADDPQEHRSLYTPNVIEALDHYGHVFRGQPLCTELKDLSHQMFLNLFDTSEKMWGDKVELMNMGQGDKLDHLKIKLLTAETDADFQALKEEYMTIMDGEYYKAFKEVLQKNLDLYKPEMDRMREARR